MGSMGLGGSGSGRTKEGTFTSCPGELGVVPPGSGEMVGCLGVDTPKFSPRGQCTLEGGRLENKKMPIFRVERQEQRHPDNFQVTPYSQLLIS